MQNVAVDGNAGPRVYVDYAHTPDALAKGAGAARNSAGSDGGGIWLWRQP
jgi:UDP-N-acetylmuramyl tripeptide synthase